MTILDQGGEGLVVLHVHGDGAAVAMALDQLLGLAHRARSDRDRQVLLLQQIVHARAAHQPGAQNQYLLHVSFPPIL
jgi:hypothetical protein